MADTLIQVLSSFLLEVNAIRSSVSKISELRFPTFVPLLHAEIIGEVAQKVEKKVLKQIRNRGYSPYEFTDNLRHTIHALHDLGSNLRYSERAETRRTPWSIVRPIEKLGEIILPNSVFLIRPQWSFTYSVTEVISIYKKLFVSYLSEREFDNIVKRHLPELLKEKKDYRIRNLYVIGFPYLARLDVLLHTIIGHEYGHPIADRYFLLEPSKKRLSKKRIRTHVRSIITVKSTGESDLLKLRKLQMKRASEIYTIRRRAMEELACDLVCFHLFGFATMMSLLRISHSEGFDQLKLYPIEEHYPPTRYRLRFIWNNIPKWWVHNYLRESKYDARTRSLLFSKLREIKEIVSKDTDWRNIIKDPKAQIAYESVTKDMPIISRYLRMVLKRRNISIWDQVNMNSMKQITRLENGIPPITKELEKYSTMNSMRSLINAGWIYYLVEYEANMTEDIINKPIKSNYIIKVQELNRLLLKAIEYADLQSLRK